MPARGSTQVCCLCVHVKGHAACYLAACSKWGAPTASWQWCPASSGCACPSQLGWPTRRAPDSNQSTASFPQGDSSFSPAAGQSSQQLRPSLPTNLPSTLALQDPTQRLGARAGADEVRQHPWFAGVSWALGECGLAALHSSTTAQQHRSAAVYTPARGASGAALGRASPPGPTSRTGLCLQQANTHGADEAGPALPAPAAGRQASQPSLQAALERGSTLARSSLARASSAGASLPGTPKKRREGASVGCFSMRRRPKA